MKHMLLACSLALSPTIVAADIDFPALTEYLEGADFADFDRSEFVAEMERIYPDFAAVSMLLFARASPEIEALIPEMEWGPAHNEAYGCLYDGLAKENALEELNEVNKMSASSLTVLKENPGLNFTTIDEYPDYLAGIAMPTHYSTLLGSCGIAQLNAEAFADAGLWEALAELQ